MIPEHNNPDQHSSGFHHHLKALLAATSGTLVLIAIGTVAFNSINAKISSIATTNKEQISASTLADYKATALTGEIVSNDNLRVGSFESITGLGELTVGSIAPGFGTINTTNNITTTATIQGASFSGNGANLTNLDASNISSGTVANARLSTNVTLQGNTFNGASQLVQTTAGGLLPAISGANLTNISATNIASGTIADSRLSTNVALLNAFGPQTFSGNNKFTGTLLSQNTTNSSTAFQVQNAAGTAVLITDTINSRVGIGTATPTASLEVNNTAAIPTGPELITNGTFTGGTTGWTLGSDVAYGTDSVVSTYNGGYPQVSTTFESVAGNTYLLTFNISAANAPMYVYLSNNTGSITEFNFFNGQATIAFEATYTGTDIVYFDDFKFLVGDTWTLDNVSLKQTTTISPALKVVGYDGSTWLSLGGDLIGNTALGQASLKNTTTGYQNTAVGNFSLQANTIGSYNTAIGFNSLQYNTDGSANTAVGVASLQFNTTGYQNTAVGTFSLLYNTTGSDNTALGFISLYNNTTGSLNTALGRSSLHSNTTGSENTATGINSLFNNTTGAYNTALGGNSLYFNTTGSDNTALGGWSLTSNTTGVANTALGSGSLQFNTTGGNNTALGYSAGYTITTGSNNLLLGYYAGTALTTGSNNVGIGQNVVFASATANNQLQIGAGISGDLALGTLKLSSVTNSTTAFQVQNAASVALFTADTSSMVITVAGTSTTFASLTLDNAHFKSTQTTAPTIGTPANCGTSPSAVVTTGSTDSAGSFSIIVGTGGLSTTCAAVLTFNKPYAAAPKSIIITSTQAVGGANVPLWFASISASSITGFTVKEANLDLYGFFHAAGDITSYYYWVIE